MTVTCWSLLVSLSSSDHFSADSVQLVQDFSPLWSWELIWWLRIFFSPKQANRERMWHGMKKTHLWKRLLRHHQSLCSPAQGSSLLLLWRLLSYSREQMHCTDLCSQALHAAHMPGKDASTLQQIQKPSIYRGWEDGESNSYHYKGDIIQFYKRSHMPRF